jgi:hypothetical protein
MDSRKTFDKKYEDCLSKIKHTDFSKKADILGAHIKEEYLILDFFNRQIIYSEDGFKDANGEEITYAVKLVLCKYLSMCPDNISESSGKLVTFRELAASGPLFSSFTANTNKIIETAFSGNLEALKSRCLALGGLPTGMPSYDLSMQFKVFPRISVIINFNDEDDLMPAKAVFLYHDNADIYLDVECLMTTCTYLTGQLIQHV